MVGGVGTLFIVKCSIDTPPVLALSINETTACKFPLPNVTISNLDGPKTPFGFVVVISNVVLSDVIFNPSPSVLKTLTFIEK